MGFDEFFAQATTCSPYAYQRKLAEEEWPDALIAPTGLGKTAAVMIAWLWRRRIEPGATPRRLVYCLPMRTLVEQTARNARCWLERLARDGPDQNLPRPDEVHVLMGGVEPPRGQPRWYEAPERPAILIGTQDMLISRALMRGYASGRARWPTEFALLHSDACWVFDEVQLMGAGLATSTQLAAFRERLRSALPTKSLWVSATLDPEWLRTVDFAAPDPQKVLRVPDDVPEDAASSEVRKLIEAHKPLQKATVAPAGAKKADIDAYIRALAEFVRNVRVAGRRTLVIVNTVDRAQKLYAALRKADTTGIVLIHSRFRPTDREGHVRRMLEAADSIVVATQAIEAGVDISSAVMITELAPWASLVQRFGRVNRYGERKKEEGGAPVHWVDLPAELAAPYEEKHLAEARALLLQLADAAPMNLRDPGQMGAPRRVIRQKDLIDLFDTDPDLTGFDVDISPYVRDAADTDVHVFWRDVEGLGAVAEPEPVRATREELCAVSIGKAREWVRALRNRELFFAPDPLSRKGGNVRTGVPPGWRPLDGAPWPGMTLLVDARAGGYDPDLGFVGEANKDPVKLNGTATSDQTETDQEEGEETNEGFARPVTLKDHTEHVVAEAESLCVALDITGLEKDAILRAARWHDLGKAHPVFQETMRRGLTEPARYDGVLLAKTEKQHLRHKRSYFRHELASALAFLAHENWRREVDLVAYLVAAHHGKVRMSLRARPEEKLPDGKREGERFARGIWEGDELPPFDLGAGEDWPGGMLTLCVMELGEDDVTGASWIERTRVLLDRCGPFRLAWLEALLTIADWRASAKERNGASKGLPVPALGGVRE
jgi:CRISPR-associated endonuclease/helicase Cas3